MLFQWSSGSFYQRLFPVKSLHFVHSCYSLHWLSQFPDLEEVNKGTVCTACSSPPSVIKAYFEQFEKDFWNFLNFRAEEMLTGGRMVLTFLGRKSEDHCSKESCYILELLGLALNDMVSEGIVEEEKLDSFNIPLYTPSLAELKSVVEMEGSFSIDHLDAIKIHWTGCDSESFEFDESKDDGSKVAKHIRAVTEPMILCHFGIEIIEELFRRYKIILADRMSKEKTEFTNVIVSMTKKDD